MPFLEGRTRPCPSCPTSWCIWRRCNHASWESAWSGCASRARSCCDRWTHVPTSARGGAGVAAHDPGGIDVLAADLPAFRAALTRESHTLKRALTDPRLFSGVGNAYSDEILHAAKLSPLKLTTQLTAEEIERLHHATQDTLRTWIERLRKATGDGFPEGVTAFREEMAVHGRYRKPCPVCGSPVQRIRYAENEVNYCATCQTGGRVLADRALSRLLQEDWPRSLEEWEARLPGTTAL